jgi:uncharacterized lipoprotein YmbA
VQGLTRRSAILGVTVGLAACGTADPSFYSVATVPGSPRGGGPKVISVRQVNVARYLDRQQIVKSSENFRLTVSSNDWWGEELPSMLTRVLVEELSQRLPGSTIYGENGAFSPASTATVGLNVLRLDEDASGRVVLLAQGAVLRERKDTVTRDFNLSAPVNGTDTTAFVSAVSTVFGQVADGLADMLRRA